MSDEEITVAITMKEYKELLIIKGKYEELKEQWNFLIPFRTTHLTYDGKEYLAIPIKADYDLSQCDNTI